MGNSARVQQRSENKPQGGGQRVQPGQHGSQGGGQRTVNRSLQNGGQRLQPGKGKPAAQRGAAGALAHGGQNERGKQGKGGNGRKKDRRKRTILILLLAVVLLILLCLWLRSCGHTYGPFRDTQMTEETEYGRNTEDGDGSGKNTEPESEREYEKDSSGDVEDTTEGGDTEDTEGSSEPDGGSEAGAPGNGRLNLALSDSYRITDKHRIFYIGYPKDNAYDVRFTFLDENGKELYRTKYVAPGTNVAIDGTGFLSKGDQKLDCRVSVYSRDTGAVVSDCTTIVLNIKYE